MKYEVINYKDVWGNDEDGYTVNDVERDYTKNDIEITEDMSDDDIIETIKADAYGYLLFCFYQNDEFSIDGDDERIEITHKDNGYPVCALVRKEG